MSIKQNLAAGVVALAGVLGLAGVSVYANDRATETEAEAALPGCARPYVDVESGRGVTCVDPHVGRYVGWNLGYRHPR